MNFEIPEEFKKLLKPFILPILAITGVLSVLITLQENVNKVGLRVTGVIAFLLILLWVVYVWRSRQPSLIDPTILFSRFSRRIRILSIFVLLASILPLWWVMRPPHHFVIPIEESKYRDYALNYRPNLEVVGDPEIVSYHFVNPQRNIQTPPDKDTIEVTIDSLTIRFRLTLMNNGKFMARMYAVTWRDTSSWDEDIRKKLSDKKNRDRILEEESDEDYSKVQEVQPSHTTHFEAKYLIKFAEGHNFTMHFLFLYTNEAGNLFDTYYWARYAFIPFPPDRYYRGLKASDFMKLVEPNSSTSFYPKEDAEDIIDFLNKKSRNGAKK